MRKIFASLQMNLSIKNTFSLNIKEMSYFALRLIFRICAKGLSVEFCFLPVERGEIKPGQR
jgi:hypothetical protein